MSGFQQKDLNDGFFREVSAALKLELLRWRPVEASLGHQVVTALASKVDTGEKLKGIFIFAITGNDENGVEKEVKVCLKAKCSSEVGHVFWDDFFKEFGPEARKSAQECLQTGIEFEYASDREVLAARLAMKDEEFSRIRPKVYHTVYDAAQGISIVVMEYIRPEDILIGGNVTQGVWENETRFAVLQELARFHAHFLVKGDSTMEAFGGILKRHPRRHLEAISFWKSQVKIFIKTYPHYSTKEFSSNVEKYFENMDVITTEQESYPLTLVHNDAHPGNLWVRKNASPGQSKLILYDWEIACLHVPQFDLAVFLLCTIPAMDYSRELYHIWSEHAEFYRHHLVTSLHDHIELAEVFSDRQSFHRILGFVIFEAFCNRVSIWCILPPALRFYNSETDLRKIVSLLSFASKELPS